nr:helix-turn-helix domain-containing protein [Nocardia arizonensis]
MTSAYRERPSRLPGAVLWSRTVAEADTGRPVLPDGCIDLLWSEGRLVVAGPDTAAFRPAAPVGAAFAGIRFYPGSAPALLGVAADALRDRRVDLADLWPAAIVRGLTARVDDAADRQAALEQIAIDRAARADPPDPVLRGIVRAAARGRSVADIAEWTGMHPRMLHRRATAAFGYGPKTLTRVLRFQRALALTRAGAAPAEAAAVTGFADQAHLSREVRELSGMPLRRLLAGDPLDSRSG